MLEKIKGLNMNIQFKVAGEIPMPILAVDKVSFGYKGQRTLFSNVDFGLNMVRPRPTSPERARGRPTSPGHPGSCCPAISRDLPRPRARQDSRVALVGANGTGKSTLLKLMLEDLEPTKGEVRQSRMCKVGVYDQHSCDQLAKGVRLAKGAKLAP